MHPNIILSGVIVLLLCPLLSGLDLKTACLAVSVVGLILIIIGIAMPYTDCPADQKEYTCPDGKTKVCAYSGTNWGAQCPSIAPAFSCPTGQTQYTCPDGTTKVCALLGESWQQLKCPPSIGPASMCPADQKQYTCPDGTTKVCAYSGTNWGAQCPSIAPAPPAASSLVRNQQPQGIVSLQSSKMDQPNFQKNNEDVVVVYVMESCIHCKKLMPLLKEAVEKTKKTVYEIKNDTEENKRHIREAGVNGFPTMRKYKGGNWKNFKEFEKQRTVDNLSEFLLSP